MGEHMEADKIELSAVYKALKSYTGISDLNEWLEENTNA